MPDQGIEISFVIPCHNAVSYTHLAGRASLSGVLTHHADFATASSRKELTKFMDYLKVLTVKKDWRILLFSDLGRK